MFELSNFFFREKLYQFTLRKLQLRMLSNDWTPFLILKQSWDRKLYPISPQALPWILTLNLFSIHTFSKLVAIWTLVLWQLLEAEHHRAYPGLWQKTSLYSLRSFKFGHRAEGGWAHTFPCLTFTISTLYSFGLLFSQSLFSEHNALSLCALYI